MPSNGHRCTGLCMAHCRVAMPCADCAKRHPTSEKCSTRTKVTATIFQASPNAKRRPPLQDREHGALPKGQALRRLRDIPPNDRKMLDSDKSDSHNIQSVSECQATHTPAR